MTKLACGPKSILILLLASLFCVPWAAAQTTTAPQGQWSPVAEWYGIPIHAHLLPTGQVLYWESSGFARFWDPATNEITAAPASIVNIFCTGHSYLADGRLLVTGGHVTAFVGLPDTGIYDPFQKTWTKAPDMVAARWYPTNTTLANGDVLVVAGQIDTTQGMNTLPEVWQAATGTWRSLTAAQLLMPFYPYMYLAPNGKVFAAGPDQQSRYLDTAGTGAWTNVATSNYGTRNWGSSVMYDVGKILIAGGANCPEYGTCDVLPTATSEIIDLNQSAPSWNTVGPMANARKHHNLTILPDGQILVTGGSRGSEPSVDNSLDPAYPAELWNPDTGNWTTMASLTRYRGYHASALLLPDGRVLSAGGDWGGPIVPPATQPDQYSGNSAEIFSPPYLFAGARPTVTSAPISVSYGQVFRVDTPDAASITKVTWIALSTVTHTFNEGQRINRLAFSQTTGGLNVTAPPNANVCPPGYYMLFVLNGNGVPSIAKFVRIAPPVSVAPAAPSALTAVSASDTRINLTWTDNSTDETGFSIERSIGNTGTFTLLTTVGANVTTYSNLGLTSSTTYAYRVRAFNSVGNSAYSNAATATTAPAAPGSLTATAVSSTAINLAWADNSSDETGFNIERSTAAASGFVQIAAVGAGVTSFSNNTGLTGSTTYYYRVRAVRGTSNSPYSDVASVTTQPESTAAPSNLTATAISSSQINLAWTDNSTDETGFNIERSVGNTGTFTSLATVGPNVTTYSDSGLTSSTTYSYRVRAVSSVGNSGYSSAATATTAPAAPGNLTATAISTTAINLAWMDNSSDETGFNIERSTAAASGFVQIAAVGAGVTSFSNTGLTASTTYYYRVRAARGPINSPYSAVAGATTQSGTSVNGPPRVDSVSPANGSGSSGTFVFSFSDPNGHTDITAANVLINAAFSGVNGCWMYFDRAANQLFLASDNAAAWNSTVLGSGSLSNSQCTINTAQAGTGSSGNGFTLTLPIVFTSSFLGVKQIHANVYDSAGLSSGYQQVGTWTVASSTPDFSLLVSPASQPITPGGSVSYTVTVQGSGGFSGAVALQGSGFPPGWNVTFNPSSVAVPGTSVLTISADQNATAGSYTGTITGTSGSLIRTTNATAVINTPPSITSLTPNSGTGNAQVFTIEISDAQGFATITGANLLINSSFTGANGCWLYYNAASNSLSLASNNVASWQQGTLGSAGTLQNSQCSVALNSSSAVGGGNTRTLQIALSFTTGFAGSKAIYGACYDSAGGSIPYQQIGTWSVQ